MSDELRHRLENAGRDPVTPLRLDFVKNRARRLTIQTLAVAVTSLAVLVAGAFAVRSAISTDAAPLPPAERENPLPGPIRNGRIVHSAANVYWQGDTPVPQPGAKPYYSWDAFDQETGSFLYALDDERLYFVVDQDGLVAEFPCDSETTTVDGLITWATTCGEARTMFGPGPDEVSAPSNSLVDASAEEPGPRFVQIIGFDGTVRDKLDVSAVVPQGQWLTDLAWSPDGSRLAISTESAPDCDPTTSRCEAKVWIFDPAGGESQLVLTERTPEDLIEGKDPGHPKLRHLAWSPDGSTLSLLVELDSPGERVWDRLVALRLRPDQPVRAEALHVYDRTDWKSRQVPDPAAGWSFIYEGVPYAWSPDGTRIAISSRGGIAEISADDGTVLTRHAAEKFPVHSDHPGREGPLGSLAWLRKQ